jgi:hypothetical protein
MKFAMIIILCSDIVEIVVKQDKMSHFTIIHFACLTICDGGVNIGVLKCIIYFNYRVHVCA